MDKDIECKNKKLKNMVQKGFQGYPLATVAFYGPTSKFATKIVVSIFKDDDQKVTFMKKWHSRDADARTNDKFQIQILDFIKEYLVRSVVICNGIIGCPHEEGVDYPKGEFCPLCPYWENRDRFLDEVIQ